MKQAMTHVSWWHRSTQAVPKSRRSRQIYSVRRSGTRWRSCGSSCWRSVLCGGLCSGGGAEGSPLGLRVGHWLEGGARWHRAQCREV
jgi:hypothetical protein